MERQHASSYTNRMRAPPLFARRVKRGSKKASGHGAPMSGIAESGFQHPEECRNSTIMKIVASVLLTLGVVAGGGALADQRLDSFDEMVPQRPGMKTEEDYQRFVQEHGLPQRSELTAEEMDRLRAQSRRQLKLEEEYSRRNSSSASQMSDEEILNAIRLNMDGSYEPPSVDAHEDWPKSPEEFEKKYGRPPQRREEVDFYFGDDDGVSPDEERADR
jgi:hypothetical protein